MEKIHIEVQKDSELLDFEVIDYVHHEHNHCKFEVFKGEELVASFEPDRTGHLHICKNPGNIEPSILHKIAEKLESYNLSGH